ncbi:MAG: CpaE family protein [Rickettsiales bacterium]
MRSLFILISTPERHEFAAAVAAAVGVAQPAVFVGSPLEAASYLTEHKITPSHMLLDIGARHAEVLPEIDQLAQQCEAGTRVLAVGDVNDILLYRGLLARGVLDYLPMPAMPAEIVRLLSAAPTPTVVAAPAPSAPPPLGGEKRVITFLSSASGDGASTAAVNTAYAIAGIYQGNTVLVDMDYQFGMVAKHLDLQNQYGIRDLFDHPERGMDSTLIRRMAVSYGKLDVITAPAELRYLPNVSAESIRDMITTLKMNYDNIILDLPHVWLPWVAAICQQSTQVVLVAQLWLKSVSHAARMMRVLRELDVPLDKIIPIINRSGAKFKEAIDAKDFERVCGTQIRFTLSNDIKTIVTAEASARTVMEMEPSALAGDIDKMARFLTGAPALRDIPARGGLFARLKG